MRRRSRKETRNSPAKSFTLFGLVFILVMSTGAMLQAYPQYLAITDQTTVETIKFIGQGTALIKGNQVQFNTGDSISISGRQYIRITGNQIQMKSGTAQEGIRVVTAGFDQNALFNTKVGKYDSGKVAQVVIDRTSFVLTPMSDTILSVTATDLVSKKENRYNIILSSPTDAVTYVNENGIMLKITRTAGTNTIQLVGFGRHQNIFLRVIE